jgi:hypothetical protein
MYETEVGIYFCVMSYDESGIWSFQWGGNLVCPKQGVCSTLYCWAYRMMFYGAACPEGRSVVVKQVKYVGLCATASEVESRCRFKCLGGALCYIVDLPSFSSSPLQLLYHLICIFLQLKDMTFSCTVDGVNERLRIRELGRGWICNKWINI